MPDVIKRAQEKALIPIPDSMAEFYAEIGDGLVFWWQARGERPPFANLEIPRLADITLDTLDQVAWRTEWEDENDFRFTDDPALAKQTALRMRKWLPFFDEGNGDRICLDTNAPGAPVVFDQHDWYDGGSGSNGHVLAASLMEFMSGWASVCFQLPCSLWWPSVFDKDGGGVRWNDETEFRSPFRLDATRPS